MNTCTIAFRSCAEVAVMQRITMPRWRMHSIVWRYNLLPADEQQLFRCLAIFSGGWTLESASAVCSSDVYCEMEVLEGVATLMDKSLVQRMGGEALPEDQARFTMLETLRTYALQHLRENGEEAAARRRHLDYCLALVETGAPDREAGVLAKWLDRLEAEHDNLLSAFQ